MEQDIHNNPNAEDRILQAIKSGSVKMRPKWYFALTATLFALSVAILIVILLYLASFIVFSLHQNGAWFVPTFGSKGWLALFRALPWLLVALFIVFLAAVQFLVRRYRFASRTPLLFSLLCLLLVTVAIAVLGEQFHRSLYRSAEEHHLPLAGPFYRTFGSPHRTGIYRGVILGGTSEEFIIAEENGATSTVIVTPQTHVSSPDDFTAGDTVVVFGTVTPEGIRADGIQEIKE